VPLIAVVNSVLNWRTMTEIIQRRRLFASSKPIAILVLVTSSQRRRPMGNGFSVRHPATTLTIALLLSALVREKTFA